MLAILRRVDRQDIADCRRHDQTVLYGLPCGFGGSRRKVREVERTLLLHSLRRQDMNDYWDVKAVFADEV